jgi:hypothetical protein
VSNVKLIEITLLHLVLGGLWWHMSKIPDSSKKDALFVLMSGILGYLSVIMSKTLGVNDLAIRVIFIIISGCSFYAMYVWCFRFLLKVKILQTIPVKMRIFVKFLFPLYLAPQTLFLLMRATT